MNLFSKSNAIYRLASLMLALVMIVGCVGSTLAYATETDPTTAPTTAPTTEPTVASTTEPTVASTTEPTVASTTEPTVASTTEPATEPMTAPTTEPTTEPTTAPTTEPATEPTTAPTTEPTTEPTVTTAPTETTPPTTEEGDDFGLLEDEVLSHGISLDYSGIDGNFDWLPVDSDYLFPAVGLDYGLIFNPMEGYALPETFLVQIDATVYTVYTDGVDHREPRADGSALPVMPTFDPAANTMTIPASLLTENTFKVAIIITAVALNPEEPAPTEPTEEASTYADGATFTARIFAMDGGIETDPSTELTTGYDQMVMVKDYNTLYIEWHYDQSLNNVLEIAVPAGMTIVPNSEKTWEITGNVSAEFKALNDVGIEGAGEGGQYVGPFRNETTGSLFLTAARVEGPSLITKAEIKIRLKFDWGIWDARTDTNLTGPRKPVTITLSTDDKLVLTKDLDYATTDWKARVNMAINTQLSQNTYKLTPGKLITYSGFRLRGDSGTGNYRDDKTKTYWKEFKYTVKSSYYRGSNDDPNVNVPIQDIRVTGMKTNEYTVTYNANRTEAIVIIPNNEMVIAQPNNNLLEIDFLVPSIEYTPNCYVQIWGSLEVTSCFDTKLVYSDGKEISYASSKSSEIIEGGFVIKGDGIVANGYTENSGYFKGYEDTVDFLGSMSLYSAGDEGSEKVHVEAEFDVAHDIGTKPGMKVLSYAVPFPKGQSTTVYATLVNDKGESRTATHEIKNKATADQYGYILTSRMLIGSDDWYIKKLEYEIPTIGKDTALYNGNISTSFDVGGSMNGRLVSGSATSTLKVNGTEVNRKTTTSVDNASAKNTTVYIVKDTNYELSLSPGQEKDYAITLKAITRLHLGSMLVRNPVVFFAAPPGVDVVGATWGTARNELGKDSYGVFKNLANGGKLFKITLGDSASFGECIFNSNNTITRNSEQPVTLRLKADASISTVSYDFVNLLFVTNEFNGVYFNKYHTERFDDSIYDIDGDGQSDNYGSMNVALDTCLLHLNAATNQVTVSTAIKDSEHGATSGSTPDMEMEAETGNPFTYLVTASNDSAIVLPKANSAIYIPVPKEGVTLPGTMGGTTPSFSIRLTGPAKDPSNYWTFYYSTKAECDNSTSTDGWLTEDQAKADWPSIKMIKAVIKGDSIPAGASSAIEIPMRAEPNEPGKYIIWASAAWNLYNMIGGTNEGAGHLGSTTLTRAKLVTNVMDYEDTEYKADYNVTVAADYTTPGTAKTANIDLADKGAVNLKIVSVKTKDMNLLNYDTNFVSTSLSIPEQDRSFGIQLQMKDGTAVDLFDAMTAANSGRYMELGTTNDSAETPISVSLKHHANFVDTATDRCVEITLEDDLKSMNITLMVHVSRTLTPANASTGIDAGKFYSSTGTTTRHVNVSKEGAVTAEFLVNLIPANYTDLQISTNIPEGIPLVLRDTATNQYYKASSADAAALSLSSFKNLADGTSYSYGSDQVERDLNLILVADFAGNKLTENKTYSIKLQGTEKETGTISNLEGAEVTLTATGARTNTFSISAGDTLTDHLDLSFTLTSTAGNDTLWVNKGRGIVFDLANNVDFPAGAFIRYGGSDYTPNASGQIIVPVTENASGTMTLYTPSAKLPANADGSDGYTLTAQAWISATNDGSKPMGGKAINQKPITMDFTSSPVTAHLNLTLADDARLVQAGSPTVSITVENSNAGTPNVSLELKVGDDFSSTANLDSATFSGNTLTVKLKNASVGQTYRVTVKGAYNTQDSVTFVIVE